MNLILSILLPTIVKTVLGGLFTGKVNTTVQDTSDSTPVVVQKHWVLSKTIWGAVGVIGYVGFSIATGMGIDVTNINTIIENGGNIFLTLSALLAIYGRVKV